MLLATVFASCTDENFLAEELTGAQLTEQRAVKIAVSETGWDGQTVSVTRAGETLEALKNNSERTWDFTKTPGVDLNVLKADAAGASPQWSYSAEGKLYTNLSNIDGTVVANGVELYMMEGLSISGTDNVGKIKIDVNNQLQLDDSNIVLTISNLKKGQKVTIKFAATGSTAATFDTRTNLTDATGFDAANENTTQVGEATVAADGAVSFKNTISGSGINIYSISVTRAESDGFGLYSDSDRLQVINSHIVWDSDIQSWKGISNDAYLMLWPNNLIKCDVAFNGGAVQSKAGYYTLPETCNYDDKYTGCTYDSITFTKGLKMEEGKQISFTVGSVGNNTVNNATVTIVQSDWESDEKPHGTPKTIKFDNTELDVKKADSIPGGKVYVLRQVAPGNHTITRGSGESGIFYVAVDIPFTAYAPYIDKKSLPTEPVSDDYYGIVSHTKEELVFKPYKDNRIDLMYAEHTTSADGVVQLNFKHALGKLSVGTISNNYGENITLTQIRLSSTHFCEKGTLNLSTGNWTVEAGDVNTSYTETYNSTALAALFGSLAIPDKGFLTFPKDVAYTQIPGTVMTFEYTFTTVNNTFTVSKEMTVEKGKNIFININIGQNHEVVLQ